MDMGLRKTVTVCSYAACITLITYVLWSVPTMPDAASITANTEGLHHLCSCTAVCLTFIALRLFKCPTKKESALFTSFLGAILVLCGLLAPTSFSSAFSNQTLLLALCGVMAGVGGALTLTNWMFLFSWRGTSEYWFEIIVGSMGASVLTALVELVRPEASAHLIYVVIGAFSFIALEAMLLRAEEPARTRRHKLGQEPIDQGRTYRVSDLFREHLQTIACLAILGLVYGAIRATASVETEPEIIQLISMAAMLLASAALLVFRSKMPHLSASVGVYRAVFAIASLGFLAMPFLGEGFRLAFTSLAGFAFFVASLLMDGLSCDIADDNDVPVVFTFAPIAFVVYLMLGLGYHMKFFFAESFGLTERLVIALVCLYIVTVAFAIASRKSTRDYDKSESLTSDKVPSQSEEGLDRPVDDISRRFNLTQRESQTLALLVEGRNVPFIADSLGLSADTIRTYIKGIHAKLGVHSRQDLISFVRSENGTGDN